MKLILTVALLSLLVACGKDGKNGADGSNGATILGVDGVSTGIDFEDINSGLVCAAGGISVFTFRDINSDGAYQSEESIIKVKAICHGVNGQDGLDGIDGQDGQDGADGQDGTNASVTLETIAANVNCPTGGVKIYATGSAPVEVCNGINGLNGEQGLQGVQGIPGLNGANGVDGQDGSDGTQVLPVKFCPNDNSTFPEYGLMVGSELFAVYWGTTPASPSTAQAFLTKLVPGQYRSTGGNNCLFRI
jgi:hypothetical protein